MLVERGLELGQLNESLINVDRGGRVVLVRGEAGIGKSALVTKFLSTHESEIHAHVGYCDDLLTPQPFGPLWDMATDERALLKALEGADRRAIMEAVRDLLSRQLRPSVVLVEDTQWVDEATGDVLVFVARRIASANGMLILTYRDTEVDYDHPIRSVVAAVPPGNMDRISLGPLSPTAVGQLADDSGVEIGRLIELTGGNPLLVGELLASGEGTVPPSVEESVGSRLGKLSAEARNVLALIAVIPGRVERTLFEPLLGPSPEVLNELSRTGWLSLTEDTAVFNHEIIRHAIESTLTTSDRKRLNSTVMRLLIDRGGEMARIVHHARVVGSGAVIAEFAPKAAAEAMKTGSFREALTNFRALGPHIKLIARPQRAAIVGEWARAEMLNNNAEAIRLIESAVSLCRSSGDDFALTQALALAVRVFETFGRPEDAERASRESILLLADIGPSPQHAHALAEGAWLAMMRSEMHDAVEMANNAIEEASAVDNELDAIGAMISKGVAVSVLGEPDGLDLLEEASTLAARGGHYFQECRALSNMFAVVHEDWKDLELAEQLGRRALDAAVEYEIRSMESLARSNLAFALLDKGHWTEATDLAYQETGALGFSGSQAITILGTIQARTGHPEAAENLAAAWDLAQRLGEIQYLGPAAASWVEYCWISGTNDDPLFPACRDVMQSALERGRTNLAARAAVWLNAVGFLETVPYQPPNGPRSDLVKDALSKWKSHVGPYEKAIALTRGTRGEQIQGLETLEDLGARAVASRFREIMRANGIVFPRGRGQKTRENSAGLTARQEVVLQLLADDLTNAEIAESLFVSLRTVESHVSAILGKLGVGSRQEAVAVARVQGLVLAPD